MKQGNILLIGGGLLLLYLFLKKKQTVSPVQETKNLIEPGTSEQPILVSPLQQVSEQVSNIKDNSTYRVKYIAGNTHYI
jgi:hypothetical protein